MLRLSSARTVNDALGIEYWRLGIANTKPIALSTVEGCVQSPHKDWSTGVLEWWSDGFETQYSTTPFRSRASPLRSF
jgi:hypothetical protein